MDKMGDFSTKKESDDNQSQFISLKFCDAANQEVNLSIPKGAEELEIKFDDTMGMTTLPKEIAQLQSLKQLTVREYQAGGAVPESIWGLTRLEELRFGSNWFSGNLPESIGNLSRLSFLELGINEFTGEMPHNLLTLSKLETLDLSGNRLEGSILSDIGHLHQLSILYLHENQFNGTVPSSIGRLMRLEILDLSRNRIRGFLPHTFSNLTQILELTLSHNCLQNENEEIFKNLKNLHVLHLHHNAMEVLIAPCKSSAINYLDLRVDHNPLTAFGIDLSEDPVAEVHLARERNDEVTPHLHFNLLVLRTERDRWKAFHALLTRGDIVAHHGPILVSLIDPSTPGWWNNTDYDTHLRLAIHPFDPFDFAGKRVDILNLPSHLDLTHEELQSQLDCARRDGCPFSAKRARPNEE